jgi:OmcA/MtrC family decaheme c-type cytochrome
MKMVQSKSLWFGCAVMLSALLLALTGCSGDDGQQGPAGAAGTPGTASTATTLNFSIDSVTVASPPVVNFTVTNENGVGFTGLTDTDLRFNIAKLIPGTNGDPSNWQDYVLTGGSSMHASQERLHSPARASDVWGELVDHNDGTYTYTFATDITNVSCPAPCTTADGTPLDLSYQPNLTHRLVIQQGNSSLPLANAVYDFVPAGGAVTTTREIVKTDNCNECHDKITAHGSRFETKFCVTCHNPGSWVNSTTTVDFRVMIHKIHRGEGLPSGSYAIGSHDFSDVVFPQDIRNCTKCHDGSDADTPQGNNWQIPNMAACGSCHDDIDFSKDGSGTPPVDPTGHKGGIVTDNSECVTCHAEGRVAGSVAKSHTVPGKAERALFKYNILEICGTAPGSNPVCPPNNNVTLKFSVTDPSGATTHQYGNFYNIRSTGTDPEFNSGAGSATRLYALIAWNTKDYTNEGGAGSKPSSADSIDLRTSGSVVDNTDGTFTLTAASPIPSTATGTGAIAIEGHPAASDGTGTYNVRVAVNSEIEYFAITDSTPQPRRQIVDVPTKCDRCHDQLSVHGNNRNDNGQLCVMCHNPSNTDVSMRPKDGVTGLPDAAATVDGKTEESIDFKRMIHGIHSGSAGAHGFRENGIVVYGYGPQAHDFSDVRFPGVLSKCETCHLPDTYTLADRSADDGGNWELPAMNGIRGSTVNSYPTAAVNGSDFAAKLADQTEDYKYSPIASVCSACHDGELSMAHMTQNGAILGGAGSEQTAQEGNIEGCPVCHGPGKIADVKLVHDQAFANFLGDLIP